MLGERPSSAASRCLPSIVHRMAGWDERDPPRRWQRRPGAGASPLAQPQRPFPQPFRWAAPSGHRVLGRRAMCPCPPSRGPMRCPSIANTSLSPPHKTWNLAWEVNHSASEVNVSASEVNHSASEVNHSAFEVNHSASEVNVSASEVNHSDFEVNHSDFEVNRSASEVNHSASEVNRLAFEVNVSASEVNVSA